MMCAILFRNRDIILTDRGLSLIARRELYLQRSLSRLHFKNISSSDLNRREWKSLVICDASHYSGIVVIDHFRPYEDILENSRIQIFKFVEG